MGGGASDPRRRLAREEVPQVSLMNTALALAALGFHVFPLIPGTKIPAIKEFPERATRDPEQIRRWWSERPYNIGISTTRFRGGEALVAVDVDTKKGKRGDLELFRLEIDEGRAFPTTYNQATPTGGRHMLYSAPSPVKQGENVLARGLDIRGKGGYVVGAESIIDGTEYTGDDAPVARAPQWLVDACGAAPERSDPGPIDPRIDQEWAAARALDYLTHVAPTAVEGDGGDATTYRIACRVKDQGVDVDTAFELMAEHWNPRCSPPWEPDDLRKKVQNAYAYGQEAPGSAAPEVHFAEVQALRLAEQPLEALNREYAFVTIGGGAHILWETVDADGRFRLEHLTTGAFHQKLAAETITLADGKTYKLSRLWIASKSRRSYDGMCFRPQRPCRPSFYNLWRGFAVEPLAAGMTPSPVAAQSVAMWLDHARVNVCGGDPALLRWLVGLFAHLAQKPWEKPHVAVVLRGGKGVGKNALVERVAYLLGGHYRLASNPRYLLGQFNGHMENLLLFVLDEAVWAGNKQAEGMLKDLITGQHHLIEHKGQEPYAVDNCTRVVMIGNEEWIVPASQDERRFAVFDVGDGRKQDHAFFKALQDGMEAGGYALLLRYLLEFDLAGIDLNTAPSTAGLLDQKLASLEPFHEWWRDCLSQGQIIGCDFGGRWPAEITPTQFRDAFGRYARDRNVRSRAPTEHLLGKLLRECLPGVTKHRRRTDHSERHYFYALPSLDECRRAWDAWIGHQEKWDA